ncbi:3-hydroxybutyryl-CoA dehydrogenase [Sphaerotilus montanus]|nr:3-hydroxybutyryl-CoA dehydrogenase [Sphaerotilus montanus]
MAVVVVSRTRASFYELWLRRPDAKSGRPPNEQSRRASHWPIDHPEKEHSMTTQTIQTVGIIGAGTMGNGIAQVCAQSGINVVMVDISDAAVSKGLAAIAGSFDRLIKKDKLTAEQKAAALARITTSTDYAALNAAQFVIEAATENEALKIKILGQLDAQLAPEVIVATNTSSISITQLAATTKRADRFIGMHFFNPVPMMALVEIIRGLQTSDATHDAVKDLAVRLGKSPITVKNAPGFVVNRILVPMINEAFFVLSEGLATPEDIDAGMKLGCNQPIGPLALADMIGLDVCLAVMEVYLNQFGDSKYRPCPLLKEYVAAGYLGRKSGRGVYAY